MSLVFSKRSGFQFSRISVEYNTSNCLQVVQHNMNRCCSLDIVFHKTIVYTIIKVKNGVVELVVNMSINLQIGTNESNFENENFGHPRWHLEITGYT